MITAQAFLISASNQLQNDTAAGELSKYTETELKTLESAVSSNEKWLAELSKKQDGLKKNEDSVLRISELNRRKKELSTQLAVLQAKRSPRRPKKTSESTRSSTASSSTVSTTTIPAESASGRPTETSSTAPTPTTTLPHMRDEL
jgi:peptidoglycan hydrolase CwlO-like protein